MRLIGRSKIPGEIRDLTRKIERLVDDAADHFRAETPIRTGNARRNTSKKRNTIEADYPYATRLNEGYSRQAPNGMTEPTIDFIRQQIRRF